MEKGSIVDDRYRIVKTIGSGGQGTVFLVEDTIHNNEKKALKTLRKEILPKNLERMQKEVKALRTINSKFVLSILDSNLEQFDPQKRVLPYFVSEYARYGTLRQQNYFIGEIDLCLKLFRNICVGVDSVHNAGVIHRDLKPSNILLVENQKDIRIGDFGICYIDLEDDKDRATKIREKVGPLFFAAPEQTSLPPAYTKKSDIYSLGRILYFMITGKYEFTPSEDYEHVSINLRLKDSHPVDGLIQKMISFDPKNRPNEIKSVISDIDDLLGKKKDDKPEFVMSKMQNRIIKYIGGNSSMEVDLAGLFDYLKSFYLVPMRSNNTLFGNQYYYSEEDWSAFADRVEAELEQLEEAGVIVFWEGKYYSR